MSNSKFKSPSQNPSKKYAGLADFNLESSESKVLKASDIKGRKYLYCGASTTKEAVIQMACGLFLMTLPEFTSTGYELCIGTLRCLSIKNQLLENYSFEIDDLISPMSTIENGVKKYKDPVFIDCSKSIGVAFRLYYRFKKLKVPPEAVFMACGWDVKDPTVIKLCKIMRSDPELNQWLQKSTKDFPQFSEDNYNNDKYKENLDEFAKFGDPEEEEENSTEYANDAFSEMFEKCVDSELALRWISLMIPSGTGVPNSQPMYTQLMKMVAYVLTIARVAGKSTDSVETWMSGDKHKEQVANLLGFAQTDVLLPSVQLLKQLGPTLSWASLSTRTLAYMYVTAQLRPTELSHWLAVLKYFYGLAIDFGGSSLLNTYAKLCERYTFSAMDFLRISNSALLTRSADRLHKYLIALKAASPTMRLLIRVGKCIDVSCYVDASTKYNSEFIQYMCACYEDVPRSMHQSSTHAQKTEMSLKNRIETIYCGYKVRKMILSKGETSAEMSEILSDLDDSDYVSKTMVERHARRVQNHHMTMFLDEKELGRKKDLGAKEKQRREILEQYAEDDEDESDGEEDSRERPPERNPRHDENQESRGQDEESDSDDDDGPPEA